jgi:hypothetical protein
MKTQIVIHLLPQEIDWFEWQAKQLKQASYYIEDGKSIIVDVTLNLNLVDWSLSKLPKEFFVEKFNQIQLLFDWSTNIFTTDDKGLCMGCDDKRRQSVRTTEADNILYLDNDIIFNPTLLHYIIEATKAISEEYYIVSPQTIKLWDNTWDVLVNQSYINEIASHNNYYNYDPYKIIAIPTEEVSLRQIETFKFGGGWFNLISTKLLKLTDIPDSFGPYGVDDTYVMYCCEIMKYKNIGVSQYVLENMIVTENNKYRFNPYSKFIKLIDKKNEYRKIAESNLEVELFNFSSRLNR